MTNVAEASLGRLRDRTAATSSGVTGEATAREAIDTVLHRRLRPMVVRVAGRRGVGKSAILAVLESVRLDADGLDVRVHESSGAESSERTQSSDVLVYVLAGAVSPVD
ncbi:MAG: hypothetical protein V7694_26355, partial [Rhodococcus sp. (in: high G+C Gram-positive bacteria)]